MLERVLGAVTSFSSLIFLDMESMFLHCIAVVLVWLLLMHGLYVKNMLLLWGYIVIFLVLIIQLLGGKDKCHIGLYIYAGRGLYGEIII